MKAEEKKEEEVAEKKQQLEGTPLPTAPLFVDGRYCWRPWECDTPRKVPGQPRPESFPEAPKLRR